MKLIVLLLLVVSAFAQNIESHTVPFVPPCEPGTLMFGFSRCPPVEEQGVFVHVKATGGEFSAYEVTVEYRTAAGESKRAVETVKRRNDDGYHTAVFVIGRVKAGDMPGIVIEGVAVKLQTMQYRNHCLHVDCPGMETPPLLNGRNEYAIPVCYDLTSHPPKTTCTGGKK